MNTERKSGEDLVVQLEATAKKLRYASLALMKEMGAGWLGGAFSSAEIVTALLFHKMKIDPHRPKWADRDRLIISKAHSCEVFYAALAELGFIPKEELATYGHVDSRLQVHVDCRTPGVDCSGGSLGLGLSFAVGAAMGAYIHPEKKNLSAATRQIAPRYRVYCILGDGECDEGQVWEAAANGAHFRLDNLTAFIDNNLFQSTGSVEEKMNLLPLADKFRVFGWETIDIDGNNPHEVLDALEWIETITGKPQAVIAHTRKGRGIPSVEATNCHQMKMTDALFVECRAALSEKEVKG